MWSRLFGHSTKQSVRYAQRARSPLLRTALTRIQSTSANQSTWNKGAVLGASALGLTCVYLTSKAFAQNKDSVSIYFVSNLFR